MNLYTVGDALVVVTVTYSPGPHLDRFLATCRTPPNGL